MCLFHSLETLLDTAIDLISVCFLPLNSIKVSYNFIRRII